MEEKKEMEEGLHKVRSYLGCLSEGVKLPTRNVLPLLKYLYPSFIVGALVVVGGVFLSGGLMESFVVADVASLFRRVALLLVVSLLSACFYCGQLSVAVSHYARTGSLDYQTLRLHGKGAGRSFVRALQLLAPWTICLAGVIGWALMMCFSPSVSRLQVVLFAVVILLLWMIYVPYHFVMCDYLIGENRSFAGSLARIKDGFRSWGAFFTVLFCGGMLWMLAAFIGCFPAGILMLAKAGAFVAERMGDATDLPSSFTLLLVVCSVLASVISQIGAWLVVFPVSFLYGSIEKGKEEKEKYEEEERLFQK